MKKLFCLFALPFLLTACPGPQGTAGIFGDPTGPEEGSLNESMTEDYAAEKAGSASADTAVIQNQDLIFAGPKYYIGSPYKIEDIPYTPAEDMDYNQTGTAGIVPMDLNGAITTNGEKFDTNTMVATSKTLPLPSIVRVTNLENNSSTVVRVNNRGPFVNSRLMDVSPAVARKLGMTGQTSVRIQILKDESQMVKDLTMGNPIAKPTASETSAADTVNTQRAVEGSGPYTVQVGAYYSEHSADAVASRLTDIGDVRIVQDGGMFKIQFLSLSAEDARRVLDRLRQENDIERPGLIRNGQWLNPNSI